MFKKKSPEATSWNQTSPVMRVLGGDDNGRRDDVGPCGEVDKVEGGRQCERGCNGSPIVSRSVSHCTVILDDDDVSR